MSGTSPATDAARHVVVIGAGIVGVSTAIWLRRQGTRVTLLDRTAPGHGASFGNAGVLAACSVVPVTAPGLVRKAPGLLMNRDFPLFMRWGYLPRIAPWLLRYLGHANDADTRRIARGLTPLIADSVAQHRALTAGTAAARWVRDSDYHFAYADRAAFEADAYTWALRREAGFEPEVREGPEVQAREPMLGTATGCLVTVGDHGFVLDPGGYVAALAAELERAGGTVRLAEVRGFDIAGERVRAVDTADGPLACDAAVLATGAWSRRLATRLGLDVPLESERGYHVMYENATGGPDAPTMVASGKFVATPMAEGLRCAGVVEFGGLDAGASEAPLALLRRQVKASFPHLEASGEREWLGHRPAPVDSLPLIGETAVRGIHAAFGHHHIGLTGGPKSGRLVAELVTGRAPSIDPAPFSPRRFR